MHCGIKQQSFSPWICFSLMLFSLQRADRFCSSKLTCFISYLQCIFGSDISCENFHKTFLKDSTSSRSHRNFSALLFRSRFLYLSLSHVSYRWCKFVACCSYVTPIMEIGYLRCPKNQEDSFSCISGKSSLLNVTFLDLYCKLKFS